jgi:hypothetical protein
MLPPFGWRVDPNHRERLKAYEPEAALIRKQFELAANGAGPGEIADTETCQGWEAQNGSSS